METPPIPPSPAATAAATTGDVSAAEQFKLRFHAKHAELVARGIAPTEAAALALQELQHLVPPPAPSAAAETTTAPNSNAAAAATPSNSVTHEPSVLATDTASESAPRSPLQPSSGAPAAIDDHATEETAHNGHATHDDVPMADADSDYDADEAQQLQLAMALSTASTALATAAPTATAAVPQPRQPPLGVQLQLALHTAATTENYRDVKRLVYTIFSDVATLNAAFVCTNKSDWDSDPKWWQIDRVLLIDVYDRLNTAMQSSSDQLALANTMRNALETLVLQPWNVCSLWRTQASLRFILILFDHPSLFDPDYVAVVGGLCKLVYHASADAKSLLRARWQAHCTRDELVHLLEVLQQAITVCLYGVKKLDLVYACCSVLRELHTVNQTVAFANYDAFYNDAVNSTDVVDLIDDYARSLTFLHKRHAITRQQQRQRHVDNDNEAPFVPPRRQLSELSFCDFPFVLDAGSKSRILQVDSDLEQRLRAQDALRNSSNDGLHTRGSLTTTQYLYLTVRRTHVIEDALQLVVQMKPEALKKPLKVKFVGEEGIDEGGVQKEFFQILIRQLLDPAFGMFLEDAETHLLYFNSDSLEATMEFELIGILLGIAIYNGVILDVHFPHTVYKKLMNCTVDLEDVERAMPALGRGLRQLLAFDGDVADVFQRSFEYSYEVFGVVKTVELKPGGSAIAVTQANRTEYVELYCDYVLNQSVARQYDAFHRGFHLVCSGDVLQMFRWEELHLTICGSPDLDFDALEAVTHYDDGFTDDSVCIKHFWSVVHEFSLEHKKKLLMFATGSDRVPIRGLSTMVFVISRNGSDATRLPSAHTCFNHLLLPEYATREQLKDRLLLAITQSEGFGLR